MRSVALPMILVLGGIVAAQTLPSSSPSTSPVPDTAPASAPSGAPSTDPSAATLPTTGPDSQPTTTQATTGPTTTATSGPASTSPYAYGTTYPANPYSSSYSSYNNRRDYRSFSPTTSYASAAGGPDLTPKPYPRQYSAMLSRSIFLKGRQTVVDKYVDPRTPRPPVNPGVINPLPSGSSFNGIENMLVFNGASDANGQLVAFIENTGMNQIAKYHVGDLVGQGAAGKISAITLDSIDYAVGPRVTHVNLGQNLNGQDVQIITTQPVAAGMTPTTGPGDTTQPAGTSSGTDSVIERLRKRRMQELGQ
jgi:hypothetical protein